MWDFSASTLLAIGVQVVFLVAFIVRMDSKTKATDEKAEKAYERANAAYTKAEEACDKIDLKIDVVSNRYGDTIAALRELINSELAKLRKELTDDQKYVRDIFVRRDSFQEVIKSLQAEMRQINDKLDDRFERMENKIDGRVKHG